MFSRIKHQAKAYYQGQADLEYVDSLFENFANSDAPGDFDVDFWTQRAEKAQNQMSAALGKIIQLGGVLKEGRIYDNQGVTIRNHTVWAA